MATLTVNGIECPVVGQPSYSLATTRRRSLPGMGGYVEERVGAFIAATVRIPPEVSAADLYAADAEVRLDMDDGTIVTGQDLLAVGDSSVRGELMTLRFVGQIEAEQIV